jgi:molecular chaperone DnaK (HSP70)
MSECQQAKHQLSDAYEVQIAIDCFYGNIDFVQKITRQQFEDLNLGFFKMIMKLVRRSLLDAEVTPIDIKEIVLAGGSTRIPKIQELIKETFKNSKIVKTLNVDEAAVIGAALEAEQIAKVTPEDFRITEVTPGK